MKPCPCCSPGFLTASPPPPGLLGDRGRSDWLRLMGLRHPSRAPSAEGWDPWTECCLLMGRETRPDWSSSKSAKTWESRFVVLTRIGLEISVPRKDSRLTSFSPTPSCSFSPGSRMDWEWTTFRPPLVGEVGGLWVGRSSRFLASLSLCCRFKVDSPLTVLRGNNRGCLFAVVSADEPCAGLWSAGGAWEAGPPPLRTPLRSLPAMATAATETGAPPGVGVCRAAGWWSLGAKGEGLLAEGLKMGLEGAFGGGGMEGVTLASRT